MAISTARELKIGKIIDRTLGVLEVNAVPALIYLAVLTALTFPIAYGSAGSTAVLQLLGGQLLRSVIGIVCGYFLISVMVRRTGLQSRTAGDMLLPYVGMSLLASLAVMLGMVALILPGLFFMVRWSIAQPLMVAQGQGVMASLGESWERTRGNEFPIFAAGIAAVVVPFIVIIASGMFFGPENPVGMIVTEIATSGINLLLLAMGTALYGTIVGKEAEANLAG